MLDQAEIGMVKEHRCRGDRVVQNEGNGNNDRKGVFVVDGKGWLVNCGSCGCVRRLMCQR